MPITFSQLVFTAISARLFFDEKITPPTIFGGAIIITASWLATKKLKNYKAKTKG